MRVKLLSAIISLFIFAASVFAAPFNANAKTKRIPAGTQFSLQLLTPVTTVAGQGVPFQAVLLNDQMADSDVILPSGSLVRGSIGKITEAKRLSRGAVLYLDFDHIVTPNGRQLPLTLSIVGRPDLTSDGGITTTRGYGDAMKENWNQTVKIAKTATDWGDDTFEDVAGGYLRIITLPVSAIGGGIGGAGYYVYEAVADAIRKGKNVNLNAGDVLNVILTEPVDVPVI